MHRPQLHEAHGRGYAALSKQLIKDYWCRHSLPLEEARLKIPPVELPPQVCLPSSTSCIMYFNLDYIGYIPFCKEYVIHTSAFDVQL